MPVLRELKPPSEGNSTAYILQSVSYKLNEGIAPIMLVFRYSST